jgi:hypothetical protein
MDGPSYMDSYSEEYEEQMRAETEGYESPMDESYTDGYMSDESGMGYDPSGMHGGRGPAKPVTYADHAQQAFRQGDDSLALRYLAAHAITADEEEAKSLLDQMGYNAHVKRPSFAVRWGVGIEFTAPKNFVGNVFPIGTSQNIGTKPVRGGPGGVGHAEGAEMGGMGGMMGEGAGAGGSSNLPQPVRQLTGELGQTIFEQFTLRLERGDYGEVLKTATAGPTRSTAPGSGMGYEGFGAEGGYDESGMGYGPGPAAGMGAGFGAGARPGAAGRGPRSVLPGVMLIDIGNAKELVLKAKQADVDVLCVFRISIKLNPRVKQVINETSFSIFDVASGKELFSTKPLNNIQVQVSRAEGKGDDVQKTLVSLFEHIDQNWRLGPMPALEPEQVLDRLRTLIGQTTDEDLLPVLAEVRMYHTRGLLPDHHLLVAYQRLLNDEQAGLALATGTEEEKKEVVSKWLATAPPTIPTGPRDILQGTNP